MKKIVKLLLLFVVPLLFAVCSDDNEEKINRQDGFAARIEGSAYQKDEAWYLRTDRLKIEEVIHLGDEEGVEIQIGQYPSHISLTDIEDVQKTYEGILFLQGKETIGESNCPVTIYHYVFDIYDIK